MAIDTAGRRNSAMLDPGNMPWAPDGTIDTADRLVMLEFYSGIAASEDVAIYPGDATFSRSGVAAVTVNRTGPAASTFSRSGVGAVTIGRKTS